MKKLNIPSYSALIPRDHRIRSIMDLYYSLNGQSEEVGNFMDKATEFHNKVSDYMAKADAVFRGTFTSLTKLKAVTVDANDYAWVSSKDPDGNTTYKHYRYVDGSGWTFEYTMTSPYFTADEWNSIQSGITSALVTKLSDLPTATDLANTFSTKLDSSVFNSYKQTNDTAVASKVDKVDGKQLSTNDYTTEEKNKLAGIAEGAEVNVNADWNATEGDAQILNKPAKVSSFENDSGYLTEHQSLSGYATEQWVLDKNYLTVHQDISGKADKAATLEGYGITDAKIEGGVITLGKNTITPLTEHQSLADYVKTDDSRLSDSRNAKDVYSWAKAATKPTYTKSEVGLGDVDNTSDASKPISTATQAALDKKADIIASGTFANAPASPVTGQQYFCTDKQTTEGAVNGIMIYYSGTSWTDALGRVITETTTS